MPTARVKSYDTDRGEGVLVPDNGSEEVAVDAGALEICESLRADQRVSYELIRDHSEQLRAINVVPLDPDDCGPTRGYNSDLL